MIDQKYVCTMYGIIKAEDAPYFQQIRQQLNGLNVEDMILQIDMYLSDILQDKIVYDFCENKMWIVENVQKYQNLVDFENRLKNAIKYAILDDTDSSISEIEQALKLLK